MDMIRRCLEAASVGPGHRGVERVTGLSGGETLGPSRTERLLTLLPPPGLGELGQHLGLCKSRSLAKEPMGPKEWPDSLCQMEAPRAKRGEA